MVTWKETSSNPNGGLSRRETVSSGRSENSRTSCRSARMPRHRPCRPAIYKGPSHPPSRRRNKPPDSRIFPIRYMPNGSTTEPCSIQRIGCSPVVLMFFIRPILSGPGSQSFSVHLGNEQLDPGPSKGWGLPPDLTRHSYTANTNHLEKECEAGTVLLTGQPLCSRMITSHVLQSEKPKNPRRNPTWLIALRGGRLC